jgi:hypothetical protein
MRRGDIEAVVQALNEAGARYLIAGGLAVVAHGYVRATQDIDIVLALEAGNAIRGLAALTALGFRPVAPVPIEDFADPAKRQAWIEQKGATVFRLYSDRHPTMALDLFLREPFVFDQAEQAALLAEVAPGVKAPFVGFDDLVRMKREAGRPQDLADIHQLRAVRARLAEEGRGSGPSQ